ncbi:11845_t:CDS:2 [Diversispora eburnea]|uniref:11845_t:CDS:1 n=1 Tax=Diversispora eburnea TaxID=1213867 RepID=A0A9N9B2B2_9GLOM|nr:11845_t:CDS:2 [Diversispora eburnea]
MQEEQQSIPGTHSRESVTRIERPLNNDVLLLYAIDVMTAGEEKHDLTEAILDQDIGELTSIFKEAARCTLQ